MAGPSSELTPFRAKFFKASSLASGEVSLVLHVLEEDTDKGYAVGRLRGKVLMVAVEPIDEDD
ncbi:MAG: hypothetical protein WBS24_03465 [Terriglobales bacterium]